MLCISSLNYTVRPSRENIENFVYTLPQTLPNMQDEESSLFLYSVIFCALDELFCRFELVYIFTNAVHEFLAIANP
jgi:hypothetical protein